MPTQGKYRGSFKGGKYTVEVLLQLYSWEEDGVYFVYGPAMDLTGYGHTLKEAEDSFSTTMTETLQYMENKSTMFDELERLGWMVNRKRKRVMAPDLETLLSDNQEFEKISRKPGVKKSDKSLEFQL